MSKFYITKKHSVLTSLYNKKIDGTGLAIFRITYSLVLFAEVLQLYYFRHLIFDKIPYIEPGAINPTIPLFLWMINILFITLGLFTRVSSVCNYLFSLVFIGNMNSFEYHMFYAYMGVNFLLIFLPVSQCLSIDRLGEKLKYSNTRFQYNPPEKVSVLAYFLPILLSVGFFYFDSILSKVTSHSWMSGLGMWMPASLPMVAQINSSFLLNQEWLVKSLGYITLIFELTFIFLFWFKKFRIPLFIIGCGLHIGILVEFPIPFFALGFMTVYLLLIPVSFWKKFSLPIKSSPVLFFYYDIECPLCIRTKTIIEYFDIRKKIRFLSIQQYAMQQPALANKTENLLLSDIHSVDAKGKVYSGIDTYIQVMNTFLLLKPLSWIMRCPGIYQMGEKTYNFIARNRTTERCTEDNCGYTLPSPPKSDSEIKISENLTLDDLNRQLMLCCIAMLTIFQLNTSYNSPIINRLRTQSGWETTTTAAMLGKLSLTCMEFSKSLFGITSHGLFVDKHFEDYDHIIAITYQLTDGSTIFLPIINEDGGPAAYLCGPTWAKWTYRVNAPQLDTAKLLEGIRDFTAFWAHKSKISLTNARFEILVKKIAIPKGWEANFLEKQIKKPWTNVGEVKWEDNKFEVVRLGI
jgi:predicted DCC family thiol-disulfide oxidoreductase YuxK